MKYKELAELTDKEFADGCKEYKLLDDFEYEILVSAYECDIEPEDIEDMYEGEWGSDIEFVQELLESTGDIPRDLPWYIVIDWTRTSQHVMMDYTDSNNHYFRIT